MEKENHLVAMSGGVDSSVAAGLLVEGGCRVTGVYMKNWVNEVEVIGDCPWERDIEDARAVAEVLGIEFRVVNFMEAYRKRIVEYLLRGYEEGVTPNPDVMCNREIKFGVLSEYAEREGFDRVVTGHYARVRDNEDGTADLLEGVDPNKDQSYFLALLRQEQIRKAKFPIGEMLKGRVREEARRLGLPNAEKKDSQGICFIGQVKMSDFLAAYLKEEPGNIVDLEGRVMGRHRGVHFYTLGQRRGIGVASPYYGEAYVVVEKRKAANELVIALDRPETPKLYARRCVVGELSWANREVRGTERCLVRPRYRAASVPVRVEVQPEGRAEVIFEEPQRALAPGQICAFYEGEVLLGGGVFQDILYD